MIDATQIRKGMIIIMDGTLYRVMEMQLITPGRWKAMVQTKLRNIQAGSQVEHRFRSEERLEQARLDEIEMEFLYEQGGDYFFMNLENYEQVTMSAEAIGDGLKYLEAEHGHRSGALRGQARRRQPASHHGLQGRQHRAPSAGGDQRRPFTSPPSSRRARSSKCRSSSRKGTSSASTRGRTSTSSGPGGSSPPQKFCRKTPTFP